jgi:aerobic carbon-monoxide dehydrogenase large subunit
MTKAAPPGPWIGRAMPRREDDRLLRGQGRFVDDLCPPGTLCLEFLRSPFGAGEITSLDVAEARQAPGVIAVFTAEDLAGLGQSAVNPLLPDVPPVPMQPLAAGRVAAAGQAVAAIVAQSQSAALAALDLIHLDVSESAVDHPSHTAHWGQHLPPFAAQVTARVHHSLVAPFALEPRAVLAVPEANGLTVWLAVQTPQRARDDLSTILGQPKDRLRVVAPDVGGAFGGKASLMPEDVVTSFAALTLGQPVKWRATRSEEFLAATQGRGASSQAEMTLDAKGQALMLRAEFAFPLGHWMPHSSLAPVRNAGRILPGPYAMPVDVTTSVALTQGPAVNIYRGAGRPEAAILMERLMDRAAQDLGLDPLELRRRNLAPAPQGVPRADRPCSGDFGALLDRLEAETQYPALRERQSTRRAQGEISGLGLALYVEPCGQGWETAEITLLPDGRFLALTGSSAQGQGRETAMAQIAADALGVDPARIIVSQGDSAALPEAIGALASRSTAIGGTAMWQAAKALRDQAKLRAGDAPDWPALAESLAQNGETLRAEHRHMAEAEAWASGAVLAEVTIDADTGVITLDRLTWVDDAGHVINPLLVEGQLIGGAAQGIGTALMERIVQEEGQLLTGSLMDYALPRATDMPPIHLFSQPTASPANPLGVKGVGEAGCIGVPAAILNAVMDALPPDTPDLSFPLTSEQVWRALTGAKP